MDKGRVKEHYSNAENSRDYYSRELQIKWNGSGGKANCPFHEDDQASLSIYDGGKWKCFAGCGSGDIISFHEKKHGLSFKNALEDLGRRAGIREERPEKRLSLKEIKALEPERGLKFARLHDYKAGDPPYIKPIYKNEHGDKTSRFFTKSGLSYLWGRLSAPVFYNQDALKERPDAPVYLPEGEKDADNLAALGLVAVTAGSASDKLTPEMLGLLRGRDIVILADNDDPGKQRARRDAEGLLGIAKTVKVIIPPGLDEKEDISDFIKERRAEGLQDDHIREEIERITAEAPEYKTEKEADLRDSLFKWNDIMGLDIRTEYVLDKLIPQGAITLFFGRGGIGKTSLLMQIGRAIAGGIPFEEIATIQTPVYYVDFENPLSVLKERAANIGASDNLWVWHISNTPPPPKLDGKDWELYKKLPPGLLIIDTLRASHLSDENDSRPMSLIMQRLKELREVGFTVILLHHTPKSADDNFKGSGAILDLCDHALGLQEIKGDAEDHIEFDSDNLYRLAVRIKTRFEPHSIFLNFNPSIKGFQLARDPDIESLKSIHEILNQSSEPLKQKELRERIKNDLDLTEREGRKLLKKGAGLYWTTEKGDKNATLYYPINSVCQFDTTIYNDKLKNRNNTGAVSETNRPSSDTPESRINTEFDSITQHTRQTEKQDQNNDSEANDQFVSLTAYKGRQTEKQKTPRHIDLTDLDFEVLS